MNNELFNTVLESVAGTRAMSIRDYFKPKDGLPDPNGSLSRTLPSHAIALVNKEVAKDISEKGRTKKHGQYGR